MDFSFAKLVCEDPLGITIYDRYQDGEHRYHRLGAVGPNLKLLLAVHCFPDLDNDDLIRIIGIRARRREKGANSKPANHKTPLSKAQLKQLAALTSEPDTTDNPEAPSENWASAERGRFFKPRKAPVSLRLDMDVVDWLKQKGPGYQTEINAFLRRQMATEACK